MLTSERFWVIILLGTLTPIGKKGENFMSTVYEKLLQELIDEAGPSESTLAPLRMNFSSLLERISNDTLRVVFKNREKVYDLVQAFFKQYHGSENSFRIIHGSRPDKSILLASTFVGHSPGSFSIDVVWTHAGVDIYLIPIVPSPTRASVPKRE